VEQRAQTGVYRGAQGFGSSGLNSLGYIGGGFSESGARSGGYQGTNWDFSPKQKQGGSGATIEGRSRRIRDEDVTRTSDDAAFSVGDRIFHDKFGYGRIRGIDGDKLTISFEKAGEKRVIARFVTKP
ncbi:MAG: hypothetical protein ACK4Z4_06490, partial [Ferrovibrio sp.]